jgi:hypothetical protein
VKVRAIELLRAGWGAVLLAVPGLVLASVRGVQVDRKAVVVVRILGARHLVQALSSGINPSPEVLAAGVWVDTVHSLTALGLAVADRNRLQGGLADSIVAALWAGLGWRHLHSGNFEARPIRARDRLACLVIGNLPAGRALMSRARQIRQP